MESTTPAEAGGIEFVDAPRRSGLFRRVPHDSMLAVVCCGVALTALIVLGLRWHLAG